MERAARTLSRHRAQSLRGQGIRLAWVLVGAMIGVASVGLSSAPSMAQQAPQPVPQVSKAESVAADLAPLLQTRRLMQALSAEGLAQGDDLGAGMFDRVTAARWRAVVAALHDPARMQPIFEAAFDAAIAPRRDALGGISDWLASDLGARIAGLEIEARLALIEPAVLDAAMLGYQRLRSEDAGRAEDLRRFVAVNDLIEANVAGGMNANLAFLRGMAEGAGEGPVDEAGVLADLWSQQDEIRLETEDWLMPYLALAYQPLSDEDLRAYIAFCETPAGRAFNHALLSAYEALFTQISLDLGRAAGRMMAGSDL